MKNIVACIDGSSIATAVCDAGAWASQRLEAPLQLMHVLDKAEFEVNRDLSGNLGLDGREHLLEELTALDEQRGKLALEHGKHMLEEAEKRALEDGAVNVSRQQRHGSLVETLQEFEAQTRMVVIGRLGEGHENLVHAIGSHLESVIRTVHGPILVAVNGFTAPSNFMLAYDASDTAEKALERIAASQLLKELPCHLVMVCRESGIRRQQMQQASAKLAAAGFDVVQHMEEGEVQQVLNDYQKDKNIELLVMGAYGHSRIRQFFVGSNTTKMLSSSDISLLFLR
ncbi:MAG: universal stress protein [Pseudomonadales bacterium]